MKVFHKKPSIFCKCGKQLLKQIWWWWPNFIWDSFDFTDPICRKIIYSAQNRKVEHPHQRIISFQNREGEHHHRIKHKHIWITINAKFHLQQTILIFWPNLPKKDREKRIIEIIFQLPWNLLFFLKILCNEFAYLFPSLKIMFENSTKFRMTHLKISVVLNATKTIFFCCCFCYIWSRIYFEYMSVFY